MAKHKRPRQRPRREQYFDQFRANDISEVKLQVRRDNRGGLYFSMDAMEELDDQFLALVWASMMNHADKNNGQPPHTMTVTVKVDTEG